MDTVCTTGKPTTLLQKFGSVIEEYLVYTLNVPSKELKNLRSGMVIERSELKQFVGWLAEDCPLEWMGYGTQYFVGPDITGTCGAIFPENQEWAIVFDRLTQHFFRIQLIDDGSIMGQIPDEVVNACKKVEEIAPEILELLFPQVLVFGQALSGDLYIDMELTISLALAKEGHTPTADNDISYLWSDQ